MPCDMSEHFNINDDAKQIIPDNMIKHLDIDKIKLWKKYRKHSIIHHHLMYDNNICNQNNLLTTKDYLTNICDNKCVQSIFYFTCSIALGYTIKNIAFKHGNKIIGLFK